MNNEDSQWSNDETFESIDYQTNLKERISQNKRFHNRSIDF